MAFDVTVSIGNYAAWNPNAFEDQQPPGGGAVWVSVREYYSWARSLRVTGTMPLQAWPCCPGAKTFFSSFRAAFQ
jgi:hypothetical protein